MINHLTIDFENPQNFFAVRISSDFMTGARIQPNDILIFDKSRNATDGDIICAAINKKVFIARYKSSKNGKFLFFDNAKYCPIVIGQTDNFFLLGVAVENRFNIK